MNASAVVNVVDALQRIELHRQITSFLQPGLSEGWLSPERGCEMADLVLAAQPETIVEIGTFAGRSLVSMGLALKYLGRGRIFGIDSWKKSDCLEGETKANQDWWNHNVDLHEMHKRAAEAIWTYGLDDYAFLIRAASQRLPRLFPGGIDLLYIDGGHTEAASCRDVELYLPQLNTNGFVYFDDIAWTNEKGELTTQKAQEMILKECIFVKKTCDGNCALYNKQSR